jgi:hypothetical protein
MEKRRLEESVVGVRNASERNTESEHGGATPPKQDRRESGEREEDVDIVSISSDDETIDGSAKPKDPTRAYLFSSSDEEGEIVTVEENRESETESDDDDVGLEGVAPLYDDEDERETPPPPPPQNNEEEREVLPFIPPCIKHSINLSQVVEVICSASAPTLNEERIDLLVVLKPIGRNGEGIALSHEQFDNLISLRGYVNHGMSIVREGHLIRKYLNLGGNVNLSVKSDWPRTPLDIRSYEINTNNGYPTPTNHGQVLCQAEWYVLCRMAPIIHRWLLQARTGVLELLRICDDMGAVGIRY